MVTTIYRCDGCGSEHKTPEAAAMCEASTQTPDFSPGDIVFIKSGYTWFDGEPSWVSNLDTANTNRRCPNGHGNCFSPCCTYRFYYVVTAVSLNEHRAVYHVATKAMTPKSGHHIGRTGDLHYRPILVKDAPAEVVASAASLLGKLSRTLI